jgi:hypothetical protein
MIPLLKKLGFIDPANIPTQACSISGRVMADRLKEAYRPLFQANGRIRLSYTINLNLAATTEIEVSNAIFRSLRENLLRES